MARASGALLLAFCAGRSMGAIINVPADQPDIASAIGAAVSGDEIVVAPGLYVVSSSLNAAGKDLRIRSSGGAAVTTISGGGTVRIFQYDQGEPPTGGFEGFTFTGGSGTGAAGFIGNANPTFRNCVFTGNLSTTSGGALQISLFNFGATLSGPTAPLFENCTFLNNSATGTTSSRRGGAVSILGANPTFRNCTFVGNSSGRIGGAIASVASTVPANGPVIIEGCMFEANVCNGVGGCPALSADSRDITVRNSTFRNHTTTSTAGGTVVGFSGATSESFVFENNTVTGHGSARPILSFGNVADITITGGSFNNNGPAPLGNIIEANPALSRVNLTITGTQFLNNTCTVGVNNVPLIVIAAGDGDDIQIDNATFQGNTCSAILVASDANRITFNGGNVTSNSGGSGMISANPVGDIALTGTTFTGNSGLISTSGRAAAPAAAGTFSLTNVNFSANTGGSISAANFATAQITGGSISGNLNATTPCILSGGGASTIRGTSFSANVLSNASSQRIINATGDGGGGPQIGTLLIENATFAGNSTASVGASLVNGSGLLSAELRNASFASNALTGSNASVANFSDVGTVTVANSGFSSHPCAALNVREGAGTLSGSTFRDNRSGVDWVQSTPGTLTISNCSFTGGVSAGGLATGIAAGDALDVSISACRLLGNAQGSITLTGTGTHRILNTLIAGGSDASAIFLTDTSSTTIINSTITGNSSGFSGSAGALSLDSGASATVINTIAYGNTAPELDASGSTGTLGVTFSNIQGGFAGAGNIDLSPAFVDTNGADNMPNTPDDDYRLASGSAGIDVGSNAGVPMGVTTDLGGQTRIVSTVDMGAFEFQPPSCPADFNNSGGVTVQDIFDFLAAYFANDPSADFNTSGGITVQDIFDFLAAYFVGCP